MSSGESEIVELARVDFTGRTVPGVVLDSEGDPVRIVQLSLSVSGRFSGDPAERYMLTAEDRSGATTAYFQFDTLDIALDQAEHLFGVRSDEWPETAA